MQFLQLTEPFLLLAEIENHIRLIIERGHFDLEDMRAIADRSDDQIVNGVANLGFGDYVRLLDNEERWTQVGLGVDRRVFVRRLDAVREIRNDVMHFDPDGISPKNLDALRQFTRFLQRLSPKQTNARG
jgi:hypothetical protein